MAIRIIAFLSLIAAVTGLFLNQRYGYFSMAARKPKLIHVAFPKNDNRSLQTFTEKLRRSSGKNRETLVEKAVAAGNVPDYLRALRPVQFIGKDRVGIEHHVTIWVMADYFSIGNDKDALRIPLMPETAERIGNKYGLTLPTKKLVNKIYQQATIKLSPRTMRPGELMTSSDYFIYHNKLIDQQLTAADTELVTNLIAGHKKDVVHTALTRSMPNRVAIYGWHQKSGKPIQPLSLVHGEEYVDYSHGIRFVSQLVLVDGRKMTFDEVLKNRDLALLLDDDRAQTSSPLF